jgi:hypothetical protein
MSVRAVIIELGGISAVARGLGHKHVTTVQGWWEREIIPAQRMRDVLLLARAQGKNIPADALLPTPADQLQDS